MGSCSALARNAVVAALARAPGWVTTSQIAEDLPYSRIHVRSILFALHSEGRVERAEQDDCRGAGFLHVWRRKPLAERDAA